MNGKIVDLAIEASKESEILLHINADNTLLKIPFISGELINKKMKGSNFLINKEVEFSVDSIAGYSWWLPEENEAKNVYLNKLKNKLNFLLDFISKTDKIFSYSYSLDNILFSDSPNVISLYVFDFNSEISLKNISKLEHAIQRWESLINLFKDRQIVTLEEEKKAIIETLSEEHKKFFEEDYKVLKQMLIERSVVDFSKCKTPEDVALCWPVVLEPSPSMSYSMV